MENVAIPKDEKVPNVGKTIAEKDIQKVADCPAGECYSNALKAALANDKSGAKVVQGKVFMARYGDKRDHSWVEIGDKVYDPTIDLISSKKEFYNSIAGPEVVNILAPQEAAVLMLHRGYKVYTPEDILSVSGAEALQSLQSKILGAKGLLKEAQKHNNPKDFVEQMYIETSPSMRPGETLLSKEATKETGLYHGTNPGAIHGILNTGKIQARISRLDKAGQKSVSVSGNKGVAGSYGNVIFELDPKLKVVEPPAGVVRGDYYKGFEFRHSEDIPISKIKSAFIDIGSKENLNTRIFIGWEGNQAIYKTIGEIKSQLESKGINTYVANFGNKSALSDIWQQAQAIK